MFITVDRPAVGKTKRQRWTFRLVTSPLAGLIVLVELQAGADLKRVWVPQEKQPMPAVPKDIATEALKAMREGLTTHLF